MKNLNDYNLNAKIMRKKIESLLCNGLNTPRV